MARTIAQRLKDLELKFAALQSTGSTGVDYGATIASLTAQVTSLNVQLNSHTHAGYQTSLPYTNLLMRGIVLDPGDPIPGDTPADVFVFDTVSGGASFGYGGQVGTGTANNSLTVTATLTASVGLGELLVAFIGYSGESSGSSEMAITVADSQSNTWQKDENRVQGNTTHSHIYSTRITAALTTSHSVTVTFPDARSDACLILAVVNSPTASSWLDVTADGGGVSASPSATTATTSQADTIGFGMVTFAPDTSGAFTDGNSLTSVGTAENTNTTPRRIEVFYKVLTSTGTFAVGGTLGTSGTWNALAVTYKA